MTDQSQMELQGFEVPPELLMQPQPVIPLFEEEKDVDPDRLEEQSDFC